MVRIIYPYFIKPDKIVVQNLPLTEKKLDSLNESNSYHNSSYTAENKKGKLFVFDPNTVKLKELIALGFKEKTANIFLKFRGKGFVFKEKKDLKKVYGISDNFYAALEPYILIENASKETIKAEETVALRKKELISIELNSADSLTLLELNGIGPAFAKRILKYRSLLGGYIKIEQLKEVYGFTDELYDKIKSHLTVNTPAVKKIDLNTDDFKTVNKHPYLTYELTKLIFNQRRKAPITKENLKEVLNDESVYEKVLPYLIFNN